MTTETGNSFLSSPKGIIVIVVSLVGVTGIAIVGIGASQGWFLSTDDKSTTPKTLNQDVYQNQLKEDALRFFDDLGNISIVDNTKKKHKSGGATPSIPKQAQKKATDEDRLKVLKETPQPPKNIVEADITKAFENPEKSVEDIQLLHSVLPKIRNLYVSAKTPDAVFGTGLLGSKHLIDAILPESVRKQREERDRLIESLYENPEDGELPKKCIAAHKALSIV